jgi:hypothetical protein
MKTVQKLAVNRPIFESDYIPDFMLILIFLQLDKILQSQFTD